MSSRWENSCGNGSMPASLMRSNLSRRSRRTSESSGLSVTFESVGKQAGRGKRPEPQASVLQYVSAAARTDDPEMRRFPALSGLLDFGDFKFLLRPARDLDGDDVVALAADQSL